MNKMSPEQETPQVKSVILYSMQRQKIRLYISRMMKRKTKKTSVGVPGHLLLRVLTWTDIKMPNPHSVLLDDSERTAILKIEDFKKLSNKMRSAEFIIKGFEPTKSPVYIKSSYNQLFNKYLNILNIDLDKSDQFAFFILIKKDGSVDTDDCKRISNKKKPQKHSEDWIIDKLNQILNRKDCPYKEVMIFSYNSPCLKRPECQSCMNQLIALAKQLYEKHGMRMIIGFYKPYGIDGPYVNYLPDKPFKKCTFHFQTPRGKNTITQENTMNSSNKITADKIIIEKELLQPVYEIIIPQVQNLTFLLINNKHKPSYNLSTFKSQLQNTKNIQKLHSIVQELFRFKLNSENTMDGFKKHGREKFCKCMNEISKLYITDHDANLSDHLITDHDANLSDHLITDHDANLSDHLITDHDANLSDHLITDHDANLSDLITDHDANLSDLITDHDANLSDHLITDHDANLSDHLITDHDANLSDHLITDHDANLSDLITDHDANLSDLITDHNANLSDYFIDNYIRNLHSRFLSQISKYLLNVFFPWWAEIVEYSSSEFLKKQVSLHLQESAVCHLLKIMKEMEHYCVIGYVKKENI
ncbi:uncharacterized protein LOC130246669 [Danio aesculapii]|uniref:uncharacterized protein LOC130246669 n=1 Tax=Danio aesculapii TaxID=1142201 RepID=UPI0024C08F8D|nr:uncharacterized protein LOC130246669 [Danio aesculapii]